jgi:hypothetical protein
MSLLKSILPVSLFVLAISGTAFAASGDVTSGGSHHMGITSMHSDGPYGVMSSHSGGHGHGHGLEQGEVKYPPSDDGSR